MLRVFKLRFMMAQMLGRACGSVRPSAFLFFVVMAQVVLGYLTGL